MFIINKKSRYYLNKRKRKLYNIVAYINGVVNVYNKLHGIQNDTNIDPNLAKYEKHKSCTCQSEQQSSYIEVSDDSLKMDKPNVSKLKFKVQNLLLHKQLKQLQNEIKSLKTKHSKCDALISKHSSHSSANRSSKFNPTICLNKVRRLIGDAKHKIFKITLKDTDVQSNQQQDTSFNKKTEVRFSDNDQGNYSMSLNDKHKQNISKCDHKLLICIK